MGSLKPNDLGLFDVQGNVYTWCQESYKVYPRWQPLGAYENKEDSLSINNQSSRVLRGGGFNKPVSFLRSAARIADGPTIRYYNNGFRPARTFTP